MTISVIHHSSFPLASTTENILNYWHLAVVPPNSAPLLLPNYSTPCGCCPPSAMSQMAPMSHQLATFQYFSHCVPIRIAGAFIVEPPAFVRLVMSLAKVFMTKKIKVRLPLLLLSFLPPFVTCRSYSSPLSPSDPSFPLPTRRSDSF